MSDQFTTRACPARTFSFTSSLSCAIASGSNADLCGPRSTAACISDLVHGRPVRMGHPLVAYCSNFSAAGWWSASPAGHIWFLCWTLSCDQLAGSVALPRYVRRWLIVSSWLSCREIRVCLFALRSASDMAPVTGASVPSDGGLSPIVCVAQSGREVLGYTPV